MMGPNNGAVLQSVKVKSALSCYMMFVKEQRKLITQVFPDGNILMNQVVKQCGKVWADMNE